MGVIPYIIGMTLAGPALAGAFIVAHITKDIARAKMEQMFQD